MGNMNIRDKKLTVYCPDLEKEFIVKSLNMLNEVCNCSYDEDDLDIEDDLCIHDESEWLELECQIAKYNKLF